MKDNIHIILIKVSVINSMQTCIKEMQLPPK